MWKVIKHAMKIGFLFCLIFSIIQGYKIYKYFEIYPETEYIWHSYKNVPQEATIKIQMINSCKSFVWLGLMFYILFEICLFMQDRDKHWITYYNNKFKISDKFKKISDKLEDEQI